MNNSQNIRLIRKVAKLNQQEFADKIGISINQIKNFERDRSKPDILEKKRIARFAGITLAQLDYEDLNESDLFIKTDDSDSLPIVNESESQYGFANMQMSMAHLFSLVVEMKAEMTAQTSALATVLANQTGEMKSKFLADFQTEYSATLIELQSELQQKRIRV